jgi:hypothetical protein
MAEKGTLRQLYKQISRINATFTYSDGAITGADLTLGEGWEYIPQPLFPEKPVLVNRQYIDMAGYTQDDLTFFTQAVDFQKDRMPTVLNGIAVNEYDLITTRRITTAELANMTHSVPSFLNSTLDLMECVYGEQVTYYQNTQIPAGITAVGSDLFGSGNPTASDRLHWTRIYTIDAATAPQVEPITFGVSETNLVVGGLTVEEKDLVYIERLRRAYTQERS